MFTFFLISNSEESPEILKTSKSVYRPVPDRQRRGVWVSLSKAHADPKLWAFVCDYCQKVEEV